MHQELKLFTEPIFFTRKRRFNSFDQSLLSKKPQEISDDSPLDEIEDMKVRERSNRLNVMFMKMVMASNITSSLRKSNVALEVMNALEERLRHTDKSLAGTLMGELITMKYDGHHGIQENIHNMTDKAAKLKTLSIEVS